MTSTRRGLFAACALLAACGTRTGLEVPDVGDAGVDAPRAIDVGVDAFVPATVCVELSPMAPPTALDVDFVARIEDAEIYFLVDVTGSMGGEIATIQTRIEDTIAPGIADAIANVRFSLGRFADYPFGAYGMIGDDVFRLVQPSTADLDTFVSATHDLSLESGGDPPEGYVPALYFSARGVGQSGFVSGPTCDPGLVGYPCFSPRGARVFVLVTDAEAHDGPSGNNAYVGISPAPPTYNETIAALRAIGAKVVTIYSGTPEDGHGLDDVTALARDTGAVTTAGLPLVFPIGGDGMGLDHGVIDAVQRLVTDVPLAIDVQTQDGDDTDGVDPTTFVRSVVTTGAVPSDGAIDRGDHYDAVRPGTRVSFRLLLANDRIPRTAHAQRFRMRVILRGDGATQLDVREVDIVVPGLDRMGC